jgi:hypothetical protein
MIEPRLSATTLTAQDIRALLRNDEWTSIEARNTQLVFLAEFAQTECGVMLDTACLADLFQLTCSRVRTIRAKAQRKQKPPHRPLALSNEQESELCQMIRDKALTGSYVTKRELLNYAETNFRATLTYGWIHCFLQRRAGDVRKAIVAPGELPRLQVPRLYLNQYIDIIKNWIPLVPAELIYNLDESGLSDWEDAKPKPVLVPVDLGDSMIHYPVNRQIRHQTLLCCISASGDAYCPLLVSARQSVLQVFEMGVRDGIDLRIKIAQSPYITKELFLEYLREVVIPSIESNRDLPGCRGKPAIIFCDNCSCHCSEDILRELAHHGVLLITYPPHTSHIFQVLDVLLFGRLKLAKKHLSRNDDLDPQVDHAMRVFRAYEIATTSTTVRSSWEKAGFGFVKRDGTYYLWVDEGKIRRCPEFCEVWQIDYPEARLSQRRRQQNWVFLNRTLFQVEVTDEGTRINFAE